MLDAPTCPGCGGTFDAHGLCTWCGQGIRYAGKAFAARSSRLPCPSCSAEGPVPLWHIQFRGVPIEVCPECGGAWFDLGELEQITQADRAEAREGRFTPTTVDLPEEAPPRSRAYLPCPKCTTLMNQVNWEHRSGILVDVCAHHGVWLDGGEVARVRTWAASTPSGPPPRLAEPSRPAAGSPAPWSQSASTARLAPLSSPVSSLLRSAISSFLGL